MQTLRIIVALFALTACGAEPEPVPVETDWLYSHELDLREETTGCVSVAVLPVAAGDVALKCNAEGEFVERCDDLANITVDVYARRGVENAWTKLRMKSCESD